MTEKMASHKPLYIVLIVFTWLFYVGTIIAGTSTRFIFDAIVDKGEVVQRNVTGESMINPAPWTFSIVWTAIFVYQGVWIIYITASMRRKGKISENYVYTIEGVCPALTYLFYMIGCAGAIAWTGLFVYSYLLPTVFPLLISLVFFYAALIVCYRDNEKYKENLVKDELSLDLILIPALIHNGIAIFTVWINLAFFVQLASVLKYVAMADDVTSCCVILTVVLSQLFVGFILQNFVFVKHCQFTFTPYVVVFLACLGILTNGLKSTDAVFILMVVILIIDVILLITTITLVVRRIKKPVDISDKSDIQT